MNKQIEEMEIALHESQHEYDKAWHECFHHKGVRPERENVFYAKYLIEKKGYRKQEDVAREIFAKLEEEIEPALESNYRAYEKYLNAQDSPTLLRIGGKIDALRGIYCFIEELKKKYEVEDNYREEKSTDD